MIPIVKAECYVAVLLNFKYNDTASKGMNGSCRDEHGVARLRDDAYEVVLDRSVGK